MRALRGTAALRNLREQPLWKLLAADKAPVVIALLLSAYVSRTVELLRREGGRSFTLLQLAAGAGMLPMILHSLFEFPLHMPANGMWFATLAGVMFHAGVAARVPDPDSDEQRRRKRIPVSLTELRTPLPGAAPGELAPIDEGLPEPGAGRG